MHHKTWKPVVQVYAQAYVQEFLYVLIVVVKPQLAVHYYNTLRFSALLATRSLKINPLSSHIAPSNLVVPRKNNISEWMLVEHVVEVFTDSQEHVRTYTYVCLYDQYPGLENQT